MRQESARVNIDGMAARWLNDGHAIFGDAVPQKRRGSDAVAKIILIERLDQSNSDGIEVAASQTAVGWEPFGENQQILFLLSEKVVISAQKSADISEAIFLGGHGAAVRMRKNLLGDFARRLIRVSRFSQLDEVRVFREAAGIDIERNAVLFADLFDLANVGKRNRLTAPGIIRNREHYQRNLPGPFALNQLFKVCHMHVSLEGMNAGRLL